MTDIIDTDAENRYYVIMITYLNVFEDNFLSLFSALLITSPLPNHDNGN